MADTIKLSSRGMSSNDLGTVKGRGRALAVDNYDSMSEMLSPPNKTRREQRAVASESWDDDFFTQGSASTSSRPHAPPRPSYRTSVLPQSTSQLSLHQTPRQKGKLQSSRSNSSLNSFLSDSWDDPALPPRPILQPSPSKRSTRPLRSPLPTELDNEGIENGSTSKKEKRTSWRKSLQRSLSGRMQREVVVEDVPSIPGQFVVLGRRSRGSSTAGTDGEGDRNTAIRSNRSSVDWSDSGRDPFPRSTSLQFAPRPDVPYRKVSTGSASTASSRIDLERWREGTDTEGEFSEFSGDEFVEREVASHLAGVDGVRVARRRSKRLKKRKDPSPPPVTSNSIGIYANSRRPSIPLQMRSEADIQFPSVHPAAPSFPRRSSSSSKPPVARRTTSGACYNLISRSTSAIQSISKRAPSPVQAYSNPLAKSLDNRSSSSVDVRLPPVPSLPASTSVKTITRKHRPSASVDNGQLSFFARARSISRPTKVVPPPTPPRSLVSLPTYENRQSVDLSDDERMQADAKYSTVRQKRLATIPGSSSTVRHDRRSPSSSPTLFRSPPLPLPRISHRPILSLSSAPRSNTSALPPKLRPLGLELGGGDALDDNGMGSLRIPRRLMSTQAKIEEDMERIKEFARGIDDLKQLQFQYLHLISLSTSPPPTPQFDAGFDSSPSVDALEKMSQAVKRIEVEYARWWEQASFLISLGEGEPSAGLGTKRDRCVSLAAPSTIIDSKEENSSTRAGELDLDEEEERPAVRRGASESSVDSRTSISNRQREMFRGVLSATKKGSSLPSRGIPVTRSPLTPLLAPIPTLAKSRWSYRSIPFANSIPHSATLPVLPTFANTDISLKSHDAKGGGTKSKNGIKDFITRLRTKAFEDAKTTLHQAQNRSVSDPTHSNSATTTPRKREFGLDSPLRRQTLTSSASHSSSEEEDWDLFSALSPQISGSSPATSGQSGEGVDSNERHNGVEKIELTTEGMPSLLLKVDEVRDRLRECISRLKGVTV